MDKQVSGPVILASASPRRRRILERFQIRFEVHFPDVDEVHWAQQPEQCVCENARRKQAWCATQDPDGIILAADTLVLFKGKLIGKPSSLDDAREMLMAFSGALQTVLTATVVSMPNHSPITWIDNAEVSFKPLSESLIDRYLSLVDPLDKAGGYDVDQHGDLLVDRYSGEWSTIMGLPESRVRAWLQAWNIAYEYR